MGGLYLFAWCQNYVGHFGTALPLVTGLGLSLALAAELGLLSVHGDSRRSFPGLLHFVLAASTVALPWITEITLSASTALSAEALARPFNGLLYASSVATVLIGVPAFLLARLGILSVRHFVDPAENPQEHLVRMLVTGLLCGLVISVFLIAPFAGAQGAGWLASLGGALMCVWSLTHDESFSSIENAGRPNADSRGDLYVPQTQWNSAARTLNWAAVLCIGALLALTFRIGAQLTATSPYLLYAGWTAVGAGWILGQVFQPAQIVRQVENLPHDAAGLRGWACLLAAVWSIMLIAGFSEAIHAVLALNAFVANIVLQLSLRSALIALTILPLGWAWGVLANPNRPHDATNHATSRPTLCLLPLIAGYLLCRWFVTSVDAVQLVSAAAYALTLLAAGHWFVGRALPSGWWRRLAAAAAAAVALAGPLSWNRYDPQASAELLFSTTVFMARQQGIEPDMLRVLDEGRPLAKVEGEHGVLTLWKHRGVQFQFRENGIPKGVVTAAPHIYPHYSAEVLPAAIPLVLHERPRHVLLLGVGSGVPLSTCLRFPIQDVTCAEPNAGLVKLLRGHVWPEAALDPLKSNRVHLLPLDAVQTVACRSGRYDVVISSPDMAALHRSTANYTREFYRQAARQLSADGIFCQRLQCIDFGPQPLRVIARTMQSAFRDVIFIEVAAGEFVLLGSNSPAGLVRGDLMERLQAPHVGRVLAQIGWDWSMPLNLSAFDNDALDAISQQDSIAQWLLHAVGLARSPRVPAGVNTAAGGRLAFTLPQDVMRWAPKMQEAYSVLAPHSGRLAEWGGIDSSDPDLLRRLSEVTGQRKLMAENADQYWDYRQAVRDHIKQGARTRVIPVKGEAPRQEIHPIDSRRMAYFEALGKAINEQPLQAATVDTVAEFAAPYDPMISYFLHQEVAELHARAVDRDVRAELGHRLHAIYFAHGADRSVRDIADVLKLLAEHPEAADTPQARFDHLNALLQILRVRWELRGANPPAAAHIMMSDADQCLAAAEAALQAMDDLSRDLPAVREEWPARRRFLERTVERPLRTYRTRLLPHHLKDLKKTAEALDAHLDEL